MFHAAALRKTNSQGVFPRTGLVSRAPIFTRKLTIDNLKILSICDRICDNSPPWRWTVSQIPCHMQLADLRRRGADALRASPPRRRTFANFYLPRGAFLVGIQTFVKLAKAPQIIPQMIALKVLANLAAVRL
jgi:hypothetical protein